MSTPANALGAAPAPARPRRSLWPARLDLAQSLSGLVLGLFMWGHMFFVSSILLGYDAMWTITKMFEGYFFFGTAYPILVSFVVAFVFVLFIAHAALAVRKFPISYRQYRAYRDHMGMMRHEDTTLWYWQVVTGFAMFFLASVHMYQMMMHPAAIGPWESADRVWSGLWWPLYLVLLFAVELHGGIGLYRLCVKWGWLEGKDPAVRVHIIQVLSKFNQPDVAQALEAQLRDRPRAQYPAEPRMPPHGRREGVLSGVREGVDATGSNVRDAISRDRMTLSDDFVKNYRMSPEQTQVIVEQAGRQVGNQTRAAIGDLEQPGTQSAFVGIDAFAQLSAADTEVIDALVALGYSIVEAQRAVQLLPKEVVGIEARLRLALSGFGG